MAQKSTLIPAALDLAARISSGAKPVRSVTGEAHLLASGLLALEGALRAIAAHDRSATYQPGEHRADGAAPKSTEPVDAWATPREIALGLLPDAATPAAAKESRP